jgi:hypothetical protein
MPYLPILTTIGAVALCAIALCTTLYLTGTFRKRRANSPGGLSRMTRDICYAFGMSYDIRDEGRIMLTLRNKTIEEISQYADIIAKQNAENEQFLHDQLPGFTYESTMSRMENLETRRHDLNPTSIGNIAFVAIHAPPPYNAVARRSFDLMMSYL